MNEVVEHLSKLIQINTSNPPGNEIEAILYLKNVLEKEGLSVFIQETAPSRGNLVVRVKGSGEKKPLHIHSHVDVVHAEPQFWKHDPFSAAQDDGCIYGRGTIDMKNFTAQCLMTVLTAKREKWNLKRDLIMSAVADEETGGRFGMEALVKAHPEQVRAEYSIGEVGGYTTYIGGQPCYPIQVGEKGTHWIEVTFKGEPGHGSVPGPGNVHWRVADFLAQLRDVAFPFHPTDSFLAFIDGMSRMQGPVKGSFFKLMKTDLAPKIMKKIILSSGNQKSAGLLAMMTNTVNPTGINSGKQHNVVPSIVTIKLDCRVIPGVDPQTVIKEIRSVTNSDFEYKVVNSNPGHQSPIKTPLFELISKKVESAHPGSFALPWLTVGYTDASQLCKLGNICYGFTPVKLPPDLDFSKLYHGHNERIPIDGYVWGTNLFLDIIKEFCCT